MIRNYLEDLKVGLFLNAISKLKYKRARWLLYEILKQVGMESRGHPIQSTSQSIDHANIA